MWVNPCRNTLYCTEQMFTLWGADLCDPPLSAWRNYMTWLCCPPTPHRVHATDKEQTVASLFAREILHLKERSRECIVAEMWFSFWITASFFLVLKMLISHPWDMLLLLHFFRLTCFWKAADVRTFLLLFELLPRQKRGVYHDFHPSASHRTSFDDSNLACFPRFSLKQVICRAVVGWLCFLQRTLAPSCVIWVRVNHQEAHSAAWTTNKDRVGPRWSTLKCISSN